MVNKEEHRNFELSTGTDVFVQAVNGIALKQKLCISFDGKESNYSIWITREEAQQLAKAIDEVVKGSK